MPENLIFLGELFNYESLIDTDEYYVINTVLIKTDLILAPITVSIIYVCVDRFPISLPAVFKMVCFCSEIVYWK